MQQPAQQCFHRQAQRTGRRQRRQALAALCSPATGSADSGISMSPPKQFILAQAEAPVFRARSGRSDRMLARQRHRQRARIVAVQYLHAVTAEICAFAAA
jgi:hypothetical protein